MQTPRPWGVFCAALCTVNHVAAQCLVAVGLFKKKKKKGALKSKSRWFCIWKNLSVFMRVKPACLSVCTVFVLIECALDKIHETRSCSVCFSFLLPFLAQSPETAGDGGECWCHPECVVVLPLALFSFSSPVLFLIRCWVLNHWRTMLDAISFKRASLPLNRQILHNFILLDFSQQHLSTSYKDGWNLWVLEMKPVLKSPFWDGAANQIVYWTPKRGCSPSSNFFLGGGLIYFLMWIVNHL